MLSKGEGVVTRIAPVQALSLRTNPVLTRARIQDDTPPRDALHVPYALNCSGIAAPFVLYGSVQGLQLFYMSSDDPHKYELLNTGASRQPVWEYPAFREARLVNQCDLKRLPCWSWESRQTQPFALGVAAFEAGKDDKLHEPALRGYSLVFRLYWRGWVNGMPQVGIDPCFNPLHCAPEKGMWSIDVASAYALQREVVFRRLCRKAREVLVEAIISTMPRNTTAIATTACATRHRLALCVTGSNDKCIYITLAPPPPCMMGPDGPENAKYWLPRSDAVDASPSRWTDPRHATQDYMALGEPAGSSWQPFDHQDLQEDWGAWCSGSLPFPLRQHFALIEATGHNIPAVALHPNGRHIAAGSIDGFVRLFDIQALTLGSPLSACKVDMVTSRDAFDNVVTPVFGNLEWTWGLIWVSTEAANSMIDVNSDAWRCKELVHAQRVSCGMYHFPGSQYTIPPDIYNMDEQYAGFEKALWKLLTREIQGGDVGEGGWEEHDVHITPEASRLLSRAVSKARSDEKAYDEFLAPPPVDIIPGMTCLGQSKLCSLLTLNPFMLEPYSQEIDPTSGRDLNTPSADEVYEWLATRIGRQRQFRPSRFRTNPEAEMHEESLSCIEMLRDLALLPAPQAAKLGDLKVPRQSPSLIRLGSTWASAILHAMELYGMILRRYVDYLWQPGSNEVSAEETRVGIDDDDNDNDTTFNLEAGKVDLFTREFLKFNYGPESQESFDGDDDDDEIQEALTWWTELVHSDPEPVDYGQIWCETYMDKYFTVDKDSSEIFPVVVEPDVPFDPDEAVASISWGREMLNVAAHGVFSGIALPLHLWRQMCSDEVIHYVTLICKSRPYPRTIAQEIIARQKCQILQEAPPSFRQSFGYQVICALLIYITLYRTRHQPGPPMLTKDELWRAYLGLVSATYQPTFLFHDVVTWVMLIDNRDNLFHDSWGGSLHIAILARLCEKADNSSPMSIFNDAVPLMGIVTQTRPDRESIDDNTFGSHKSRTRIDIRSNSERVGLCLPWWSRQCASYPHFDTMVRGERVTIDVTCPINDQSQALPEHFLVQLMRNSCVLYDSHLIVVDIIPDLQEAVAFIRKAQEYRAQHGIGIPAVGPDGVLPPRTEFAADLVLRDHGLPSSAQFHRYSLHAYIPELSCVIVMSQGDRHFLILRIGRVPDGHIDVHRQHGVPYKACRQPALAPVSPPYRIYVEDVVVVPFSPLWSLPVGLRVDQYAGPNLQGRAGFHVLYITGLMLETYAYEIRRIPQAPACSDTCHGAAGIGNQLLSIERVIL